MSVWEPESVDNQPTTTLIRWGIIKTPEGDFHFCGYCGEGRVSSKIIEFDLKTLTGRTRSGRLYTLIENRAGLNGDANYVLGRWLELNKLTWDDVIFVEPEYVTITP
jgi:hypothetical protein